MKLGFVRGKTPNKEQVQIDALVAAGVSRDYIYVESQGERIDDCVRALKKGDELYVTHVARLARKRKDLRLVLAGIFAAKTVLVELATGWRSDNPEQLAEMVFEALAEMAQEARGMTKWEAARIGKKGGRKAKEPIITKAEALDIWRNPNLTVAQASALIGMPHRRIYDWLDKRGLAVGRPKGPRPKDFIPPTMQVYFVQQGQRKAVKIGVSTDVERRVLHLAGQSLVKDMRVLAVLDGGHGLEGEMHKRFKKYRLRGEWFRLEGELAEFIESLEPFRSKTRN